MKLVKFVLGLPLRGFVLAVLVFFIIDTIGCSAKEKAKFEDVSSDICDIVEEYAPMAQGVADAVVPNVDAKLGIGLTLDEARHQCDRFRKIMESKAE